MRKVHTDKAAPAVGPYSQGIVVDNFFFSSGQLGITPEGELAGDDIVAQTHQVFANLKAVLEEAGTSLDKVVKATVFLKDMNDFATVNEIYASYFGDHKPARSCIAVKQLPKDALVEIEVIALV